MLKSLIRFFKNQSEPEAPLSPYVEAALRFRSIQPFTAKFYSDLRTLDVLTPTVDCLIELVALAQIKLEQNKLFILPPGDYRLRKVMRQEWFLSKEGTYLDLPSVRLLLIEASSQLLLTYDKISQEPEPPGVTQASLSRILPLVRSLILLSEALSEED